MRGYGQYCPIARAAEIFATRWTPIIVRNLLLGCRTFSELLEGAPGIPRTVLSERLRQLEHHGVIRRRHNPRGRGWLYEPTQAGEDLRAVCDALGAWGATWVETTPEHLDPYVTLWALCRGLAWVALPEDRVTLRFDLSPVARGHTRYWLLVQRSQPEVCVKPPSVPEDAVIRTDPAWLAAWIQGQVSLGHGMRTDRVSVNGPPHLVHALSGWAEQASRALLAWGNPTTETDTEAPATSPADRTQRQ